MPTLKGQDFECSSIFLHLCEDSIKLLSMIKIVPREKKKEKTDLKVPVILLHRSYLFLGSPES